MCENNNLPVPVTEASSHNNKGKRFSLRERIIIGVVAVSGLLDTWVIAQHYGCSVQYVCQLRREADLYLDRLSAVTQPYIILTDTFLEMAAIVLSVVCQASLEDVSLAIHMLFNKYVCPSKISNIRAKYGLIAKAFNESVRLDRIWAACSDEIFFGRTPVLATICPHTTYVLDISIEKDRSGETWKRFMENLKSQGLNLVLSISDAGSGLRKGISDAFLDCFIQSDLFHNLKELSTPLYMLERTTYAYIGEYYYQMKVLGGPGARRSTVIKVLEMERDMDGKLEQVDNLFILYEWIRELLGFTHYSRYDTEVLITWCLDEMNVIAGDNKRIKESIKVFRGRLDESLKYLDYLFQSMESLATAMKIDAEAFRLLYILDSLPRDSAEHTMMSRHISKKLGNRRDVAEKVLAELISITVRSSSIVENLNSRLRTAFNDMRGMNELFLELLQLFINTKTYRRSNVPERVGKSPLELYNGDNRRFLEILFPGVVC